MLWFEVFTSLVKAFSGCWGQRSPLGLIFLLLLHEFNCISICFGKSGSYSWLRASRNHFTGTNNSLQGGQVQIVKRSRLCNDDTQRLISVNFEILLFCLAQQPIVSNCNNGTPLIYKVQTIDWMDSLWYQTELELTLSAHCAWSKSAMQSHYMYL